MNYNIVLTTAEDIVAVVDAVVAKGVNVSKDFITEFTGIATDDQVTKTIHMACELQLIQHDSSTRTFRMHFGEILVKLWQTFSYGTHDRGW